MLFKTSAALALAMSHGLVMGAPFEPLQLRQADDWDGERPSGLECDAQIQPKFEDCSAIISENSQLSGDEHDVCVPKRSCKLMRKGNCRISLCNNEDEEFCDTNTAWGGRAKTILDRCRKQNAGGWDGPPADEPWTEVALRPNQEEFAAFAAKPGNSGIDESEVSVEENAAQVARIEAQSKASAAKKLNAREDKFTVTMSSYNVEKPGDQKAVTGRIPNTGGKYKVEKSKTETLSVTSSVSVGSDLFKAITAEIGIEVSSSVSVTSTSGVEIGGDCPDAEAVVILWAPLYDYYEGTFEGSDTVEYLWVPRDNDESKGNFKVRCLG